MNRPGPRAPFVTGALPVVATLVTLGCEPSAFEQHAAPVLERSCASAVCHGVAVGEPMPEQGFFLHVDGRGRLADLQAARAAALERVTTTAAPHLSSLVHVPLAREHGGGPHLGGGLFASPSEGGAAELARWIDAEPDGSGGEDVTLTELETRFELDVLPVLVARCGISGCHGPEDVANTAFPAVRDPSTGTFAPRDVRRAHRVIRRLVDLWEIGRAHV
jgi:hypothetical protein